MQTFISDLIPKIQRFSQKLDDLTLLTNQHWVVIDEISNSKNVYIFRTNNELLISSNGEVIRGRWEYLGNNALLIDQKDKSYLFRHGFFDQNILALKIDGRNEYAFLINENRYDGELNSINRVIDFLNQKYLEPKVQKAIEAQYEISKPEKNIVPEYTYSQSETYSDLVSMAVITVSGIVLIIFLINLFDSLCK